MREWCDQAGLTHCTAHGLRKAGAVIAAENGATPHQLMSIFGWRTLKEAERYTKAVQQKKLAAGAMPLLVAGRSGNESG
jgi:integrase